MQPSAPAKPFIKWQKGYMSETKRAQKNLTERKIFEKKILKIHHFLSIRIGIC